MRPNREPDFTCTDSYNFYIDEGYMFWGRSHVYLKVKGDELFWCYTSREDKLWSYNEEFNEGYKSWLAETILLGDNDE